MIVNNPFDAVREGQYNIFNEYIPSDINVVHEYTGLNLLQMTLINDKNFEDRITIAEELIKKGININYCSKDGRNALHILFYENGRSNPSYIYRVTKLLIDNKIDCNKQDIYGSIPLIYAITSLKHKSEDIMDIYTLLIRSGSNYMLKDNSGRSCYDYASDFSWRNELKALMEKD